jgi:hypothetical protein
VKSVGAPREPGSDEIMAQAELEESRRANSDGNSNITE